MLFKSRVATAFLDLQQATELDLNFANISINEALTKSTSSKKKKKKPNRPVEDQVREWSKCFEGDSAVQTSPYRAIFYSHATDDSTSPTPPPHQVSPEPLHSSNQQETRDIHSSRYRLYEGPDPRKNEEEQPAREDRFKEQHESNMGPWSASSSLYTRPIMEEEAESDNSDYSIDGDSGEATKKPVVSFSVGSCLSLLKDDLKGSEKKQKPSSNRSSSSDYQYSRRASEPTRERESRRDSFEARHGRLSERVHSDDRRERGSQRDSSHSIDRREQPVFSADKRSYRRPFYSRSRERESSRETTRSRHWSGNSSSSPYRRPAPFKATEPLIITSAPKKQGDLRELISQKKAIKLEAEESQQRGGSQSSSRSTTPTHGHTQQLPTEAVYGTAIPYPQGTDYQQMVMSHLQQYGTWSGEEARSRSGTPVMDETPMPPQVSKSGPLAQASGPSVQPSAQAPGQASAQVAGPVLGPSAQVPPVQAPGLVPVPSTPVSVTSSATTVTSTGEKDPLNDYPILVPVSGGPIHTSGPIPGPNLGPPLVNIHSSLLPTFNIPGHIPRPIVLFPSSLVPGSMVPGVNTSGPVSMMPQILSIPPSGPPDPASMGSVPASGLGLVPASGPGSVIPSTSTPGPATSNIPNPATVPDPPIDLPVPDPPVDLPVPDPVTTPDNSSINTQDLSACDSDSSGSDITDTMGSSKAKRSKKSKSRKGKNGTPKSPVRATALDIDPKKVSDTTPKATGGATALGISPEPAPSDTTSKKVSVAVGTDEPPQSPASTTALDTKKDTNDKDTDDKAVGTDPVPKYVSRATIFDLDPYANTAIARKVSIS